MNIARLAASVCVVAFSLPVASFAVVPEEDPKAAAVYSSSVTPEVLPSAPGREELVASPMAGAGYTGYAAKEVRRMGPFSAVGIAVKVGVAGIGFDVATPLAQKFNLRAGASFFSYSPSGTTSDNITYAGTISLRSVNASVDWFPFGGSFRLSPGVTLYNGNKFSGSATIAAGQQFDLGDQSYTSGYLGQNPVSGTLGLSFGNKVAPSITTGFGNIIPRGLGKHFSVPFEIGAQFGGKPAFQLALSGIACQVGQPQPLGCAPVATDPTTQANIIAQQNDFNSNVSGLQANPIISIGLGYKF